MFAAGADVVNKDVVVSDLIALLGMVPEPAGVLDQLARVIDERVVDGDDALVAVAGVRRLLQQVEAALVEALLVPVGVGEEAVEAGGVGGLGEFPVDSRDVLALGHEEAGKILGEMTALGLIGEEVAKGA